MPKPNTELPPKTKVGIVVGCSRLNVRSGPSTESASVTIVPEGTEVVIDVSKADDKAEASDFYKVCLASGVEGFCMCQYIQIK